ncbi:MAG: hypothetical protein WKF37_06620 [Bryobacteraceae bacterium]
MSAWDVKRPGSGLSVSWNLDAAELKNPARAALEIRDGTFRRSVSLQRRAGTLLVNTQTSDVSVSARVIHSGGSVLVIPVISTLALYRPGQAQPIWLPAKPVYTVQPQLTDELRKQLGTREVEIEVFVKVNTEGKVSANSTRYVDDPLLKELTAMAGDAAMRWQFEPVTFENKAVATDGRLNFRFIGAEKKPPVLSD